MPPSIPNVELVESRNIESFIPLLREIDLGDSFLLAMLHWCGVGRRATPLDYWQVFLVRHATETVGVIGLYRQRDMDPHTYWVGWFGIRPGFRRRGYGARAIQSLGAIAGSVGGQTLWVYTEPTNLAAIQFYLQMGFTIVGSAGQCAEGQTMDASDVVLKWSV
jgi:RimJ/RimL family protein N-acetyltransferase